jgi:hypothetical protein
MKYVRLAIVAVFFIALIFWLRQCSSTDDTSGLQSTMDNLKNQAASATQGQTDVSPSSAPAQTPKPAAGS